MKTKTLVLLLNLALILLAAFPSRAQNSAFTYQGRLTDKGSPANGIYDLQFILRDGDKNQIGNPAGASAVGITNGLFTVLLDFGTEAFDGNPRWLEIALRRNEPPGPPPEFVTLSPRQPITVAPYALQAMTATSASALSASGSQPLNFFVNNNRALRLEPTTNSPNVIGGFSGNYAAPGVVGAMIGGGGSSNLFGSVFTNWVASNYGTIGGGAGNAIGADSDSATIAGGDGNVIFPGGLAASIGGGHENFVGTNAAYASIPGGRGAIARSFGQRVYANGTFFNNFSGDPNNAGSAQSSLFVARRPTTNSAPTELLLDGDSGQAQGGTGRMLVGRNASWFFDAIVVARSSTGDSASFQIKNTIKNVNGTTSLIGLPNISHFASDPSTSTWNVTVEADDANDALVIKVTGADNTTIRWVVSVRTVEVIF